MKAGEVMTTGAATIRPDAFLAEAAELMIAHGISGLPVVERDRLVGIITEGDFMRPDQGGKPRLVEILASGGKIAADELNSRRVEELMTRDPIAIAVDTPVEQIVELMNRHKVKRLPVVTQGKVVGIVSRANLLLALLRKARVAAGPQRA